MKNKWTIFVTFLMAAVIALTLSACGETDNTKPLSSATEKVTKKEKDTTATTSSEEQKDTEASKETEGDKNSSEENNDNPGNDVVANGKYYRTYVLSNSNDMEGTWATGWLNLTYNSEDGWVQFDCSDWYNPNSYFSTGYLPSDGDYFIETYYPDNGMDSDLFKINLEYNDSTIKIYFYDIDYDEDGNQIEVKSDTPAIFKRED